jgi:hypothetical protein
LSEKPISPNIKADTMCAINTAVGVSDISGDISESLYIFTLPVFGAILSNISVNVVYNLN